MKWVVTTLVVLVIGAAIVFALRTSIGTTNQAEPLDTSTWKVFENPTYGYAISYPPEGNVTFQNEYRPLRSVLIGAPGGIILGGVDATVYPTYPLADQQAANILDLKSYAESIRMLQINYPSPNSRNQKVGELQEVTVEGREAYQFVLDQGFTTLRNTGSGYVIPEGYVYLYTITENPKGQKLIIYYSLGNSVAQAMFKTFTFK